MAKKKIELKDFEKRIKELKIELIKGMPFQRMPT